MWIINKGKFVVYFVCNLLSFVLFCVCKVCVNIRIYLYLDYIIGNMVDDWEGLKLEWNINWVIVIYSF